MVSLADGKITPMPTMRSFRLPVESGKWMVYTAATDSATPDSARAVGAGTGRGGRGGGAPAAARRTYGNPITLRNLDSGADEVIADVVAYQFDDSAKVLRTRRVTHRQHEGRHVHPQPLHGRLAGVLTDRNHRALSFDRTQQQFVFASDHDEFSRPNARSVVTSAR
jgi:hypothetical protein